MKNTKQIIAECSNAIECAAEVIRAAAVRISATGPAADDTYSTAALDSLASAILDIVADAKRES